jgi:molecular chaperone GrpE
VTQVKVNIKKEEDPKTEACPEDRGEALHEEVPDPSGEESRGEEREIPVDKMNKAQLLDKVKEIQETAESRYDQYLRSQAEMENMKKRFQREKAELVRFSNESLVKQLLPVLDNLEKAIQHSKERNAVKALTEGVELTLKGLRDTLEKTGLKGIEAEGEPFDPNFHEAMFEQESEAAEPGTVLQEVEKGYLLNDRLIRPAKVVVSRLPRGVEKKE